MKIATVIITFNRLDFLKIIIEAVKNQSYPIDEIFVINNNSSDGTTEWLKSQENLTVINQDNVGSSGGQYTGFKTAYDKGYDYIWTMDDDVVPDKNCLKNLIGDFDENIVRTPIRFKPNNEPFINDAISYNLSNPFKSFWERIVNKSDFEKEIIEAYGITFEGPLVSRKIIQKIGFPMKNFFIYGDDTEYFIRAHKAGFKVKIINNARLSRLLDYQDPDKSFTWKHYYIIRNIIAIDRIHGNSLVKHLRPFRYLLSWIIRSNSFKDLKVTFRAFFDGLNYKKSN
jgi:GT2 family glycosyltransferase